MTAETLRTQVGEVTILFDRQDHHRPPVARARQSWRPLAAPG